MSDWTIICDFDGTIALDDVTDALLTRFANSEWESIEADWRSGRIGSRECMTRQVALIDASRGELDAMLDMQRIDPDFPAFVADACRSGIPLIVVSDGLDYAIGRILARHGLGHLQVYANSVVYDGERGWTMSSPHARAACAAESGTCKCTIAGTRRRTLMIGDGQSDFCLAGGADYVFAKHQLIAHCCRLGIPHQSMADFREARALLARLPEFAKGPAMLPPSYSPGVQIA